MRLPAMTIAVTLLGLWPPAHADIFHWRDAAGRSHYGDAPPERTAAQRLDSRTLPPVNAEPPPSQLPKRAAPPRTRTASSAGSQPVTLKKCIAAKKKAIRAERKRPSRGDPQLESWLWKNCRAYSYELRKVSQSMM